MQFSRHSTQIVLFHVTRIVVAVMLTLALLAGIAPLKSISFASASASLCSMSCCVALPPHRPGECDSVVSCHVKLPGHDAGAHDAPNAAQAAHHAAASSHPGEDEHAPRHESQTQPTAHHAAHTAHAGTHHAETPEASQTSQTPNTTPLESKPPEAKPESKQTRRPSIAPASVSNPCPPDCGMAAGSFGNRLRSRDAATLAQAHRLRQPTARVVALRHVSALPLTSAGKHRLAPPRAPPLFPAP